MMTLSIMMKTNHRSCRLDEWFIVPYLGSVGWRGSESGRITMPNVGPKGGYRS